VRITTTPFASVAVPAIVAIVSPPWSFITYSLLHSFFLEKKVSALYTNSTHP
jgi:hypothetical protein